MRMNPVLKKELKTSMRTWRMPAMITVYTLLLSGLLFIVFMEAFSSYRYYRGFRPSALQGIYFAITMLQLVLIGVIVPTATASSICGEKQRRTFDLLICTRLSSISIVLGKLWAALSKMILLLIVSIPIISIISLFGGVDLYNIILLYGFYMITAILFGSIGLCASSIFKRTVTAIIVSGLIILFLAAGTFIIVALWYEFHDYKMAHTTIVSLLYMNPFSGLSAILDYQLGESLDLFRRLGVKGSVLKPLYINMSFDLILSCILLYVTSLRINPMKKCSWRKKDEENA
ncbi:ABC transporter permease [Crassaminicella profunda]|uniref:ABC transporter permease n=1 Tax=Crassaminicella profunda TaxID=1286698 RepID=UPI001CA78743|nr:ABC transporter permease [Crassaminicella profunda]QZY56099.1 ABC transporter permease [Crassaminicella profunda]